MADHNYRSYADVRGVNVEGITLPEKGVDNLAYSDVLKLSRAQDVVVRNCYIYGGVEDCIDMNRYCENVLIENCTLYPAGKYAMTIKGGSSGIVLRNIVIDGHAGEVDIDLGNWSDQSMEQSRAICLDNVTRADGTPVTVRVLWAEKPIVVGGNVNVVVIPKFIARIYRWLRARKLVP